MSKRDLRRPDLIVPYVEPPKEEGMSGSDMSSSLSTMFPMAAIFTKNKIVGWIGVIIAIQAWLAETPDQKKNAVTPSYFGVGMSFMALFTSYLPMFLPPNAGGFGSAPAAAAPAA